MKAFIVLATDGGVRRIGGITGNVFYHRQLQLHARKEESDITQCIVFTGALKGESAVMFSHKY